MSKPKRPDDENRYGSEGFKYNESLTERLSKSRGMIGKMCSEHRPPRMSIPAGMDIHYGGDEDLYICDALREAADRITELEAALQRDGIEERRRTELVAKLTRENRELRFTIQRLRESAQSVKAEMDTIKDGFMESETENRRLQAQLEVMDSLPMHKGAAALRDRITELEGALHELRAEGQQMHDDNLTLREQRRKSRELLERAQQVLREAKRRWAKYTTNSDADVLMADIERHLSGEGE